MPAKTASKSAKCPKAVQAYLSNFDEAGLRDYMARQQEFFESLERKHTNFTGWLCLKLGCSPAEARVIWKWATGKEL